MQFTLDKAEIINILHKYVDSMFHDSSNVSIELSTKPKSGMSATITVSTSDKIPVETVAQVETQAETKEPVKEKKTITSLESLIVQEDEPEQKNNEDTVTSGSLFSKIS